MIRFSADFLRRGVIAANTTTTAPQMASDFHVNEEVATTVGTQKTRVKKKNLIHSRLVHHDDATSLCAQSAYSG